MSVSPRTRRTVPVQFGIAEASTSVTRGKSTEVWEVEGGIPIAKLQEDGKVSALAFHPFKPLLATVAPNGTALRM